MPNTASTQAVFEFLDNTHRDIDAQLKILVSLVVAIEAGELTSDQRQEAKSVLEFFRGEARQHHLDEEKHIFPALLQSTEASVAATARHLEQDHGWLEQTWLEIDPCLEAAAIGNFWFEPTELRHALDVFTGLYQDHMTLEESVAYPLAHSRLLASDTAGMGREMAKRRAASKAAEKTD